MSLETDELATMLAATLTGTRIPEEELTRTGLDVAILEAMLPQVHRHLPYVRGFVGIDDHTVMRFWGGRVHKTALIVPQLGRDKCSDPGKTLLVVGPIGTHLNSSQEQVRTAAYVFLCANHRWILMVENHSLTQFLTVRELISELESWIQGHDDHLWVGEYRTPAQNGTKYADLRFVTTFSVALSILRGLQAVIDESNELRDRDTCHGRELADSIGATLGRIRH